LKNKYTKEDLINRYSSKMGFSKKTSKLLVDNFLYTLTDILTKSESESTLELRGFGVFDVKDVKPKPKARNPRTNEIIYVGKRRKIGFRASKKVKKILLNQIDK
jgi:integration host factor subunit beta